MLHIAFLRMRIFTPVLLLLCFSLTSTYTDREYQEMKKKERTMKKVTQIITAISDISAVLSFVIPPPVGLAFSAVAQLAKFITLFTKYSAPSPVDIKLDKLSQQLNDMRKKMKNSFNQFADLLVGHGFVKDIVIKLDIMEELMVNFLDVPCNALRKQFMLEAAKYQPLDLIKEIQTRLGHRETNPLYQAMKADPLKTKKTFEKWQEFTVGSIARLAFVHSFYMGLNVTTGKHEDASNIQLYNHIQDALDLVSNYTKRYEVDYWPEVVLDVVHEAQHEKIDFSVEDKAKYIQSQLNQTHTTDELYIIVTKDDLTHTKNIDNNSIVLTSTQNGTTVTVHRSLEAYKYLSNTTDYTKEKRHEHLNATAKDHNQLKLQKEVDKWEFKKKTAEGTKIPEGMNDTVISTVTQLLTNLEDTFWIHIRSHTTGLAYTGYPRGASDGPGWYRRGICEEPNDLYTPIHLRPDNSFDLKYSLISPKIHYKCTVLACHN